MRWTLVTATTLVSLVALAAAQPAPVVIGLLLANTGFMSVIGQDATRGFELYLEKVSYRAGGRELKVVKADTESKVDVGLTKIQRLVEQNHVDVVVGPELSPIALAIRDYIHRQGVPLVVPIAFSRDLTAPAKASPWVFRVIETTDQANFPMGSWVYQKTQYRKLVIMTADFVTGHHVAGAFRAGFTGAGGEIVKEIYPPLNSPDFAPYLTQLTQVKADAVFAFFGGADAVRFVRQYQEYGFAGRLPLLAYDSLVDDVILPTLGDAAMGIISVGTYSPALDTPESQAFVRDYEARYKAAPSAHAERGYVAAQLIVTAIEMVKGEAGDRAKLRDALLVAVTKIRPPRGPIQFDRYQQVITPVYVKKVERQGGRLVNTVIDTIPSASQEDSWTWWNK